MMEKMIKKKNIIWEDLVVRVRSLGIFTDMCQHVKNIELFGVPNPSREERRKFCYRPSGSSDQSHALDFDSSEDDSEPDESSKKRKKNESLNVEKTQALLQSQIKQKKQKMIETSNVGKTYTLLQSQIENLSTDFVKKASQIDLINDEEENDEDSSVFKWTKAKLIDLINTLKIENKKLREDNARLRTLRAINEDLYKMSDMSSTLFKDMEVLRGNIDSLRVKADQSSKKDKNSEKTNNNNNNKPSYSNENEQKRNNISNNTGSTLEIVETQSENSQQQILLSIAHIEQPEQFQDKPTITIEDLTDFAGRQIQTDKLKRLSRSKLSIFTASIMDLVFTDEEMANSSMTGIMSNFSRGQNKLHAEDVKAKPELNLPVKNAVIEYVLKEFDCPTEGPLNKAAIAEIFKAMKSKLNNKSNIWRNKNKQTSVRPVIQQQD